MAVVVRNLIVRAGADFSGLRSEMKKAQKNVQDFKTGLSRAFSGLVTTLAAAGIGSAFANAARSAMSTEAAVQQLNRTMGESANSFVDWARDNGRAFNMAQSDVLSYGAIYSNLLSSFAKDAEDTKTKTIDLLKASAVVASGTGRTMEDVMWRIRSGLLGNTEAIEDLGINVYVNMLESTEAFRRFAGDKSWDQLDFQTQQLIRYYGIMEQATKKFGTEVNKNTNSTLQQFTSVLKDIGLRLGQAFLPILNIVLPLLTALATKVLQVVSIIAQVSNALFGKPKDIQKSAKATDSQAKAVGAVGDAYKEAGDKAKEAAGGVASFDEVNTLPDPSAASGGAGADGAGAAAIPNMGDWGMGTATDLEAISGKAKAIVDTIKSGLEVLKGAWASASTFVKNNADIILAALAGIAAATATALILANWGKIVALFGQVVTWLANIGRVAAVIFGAITSPIGLIAIAIGALVGAFVYFYRTNESFRGVVDGILQKIGDMAKWLWENVLVPFGKWLGDVFVAAWNRIIEVGEWLWKNVFVPFGNFLKTFYNTVLVPLAAVFRDQVGVAIDVVSQIAKAFWEKVLVPLGKAIMELVGPAVEMLSAVFTFLWEKVLVPLGALIAGTFLAAWQGFANTVTALWNLMKPFAVWVGQQFVKFFNDAFDTIGSVIGDVKNILLGLMDFVTGVFTGDWERAWNGIVKVFDNIFKGLWDIMKFPLNQIIDGVNALIKGINSIKIDVPDWVAKLTGYSSFGFNIPKIPRLADGGITNGPMLSIIGDNFGGQEVVSPLDQLLGMIQSAVGTAILTAQQLNPTAQQPTGDVVLNIDGKTFARVVNPYLAKEGKRIGGSLITIG